MASGNRSQAAQGYSLIAPPFGYALLVLAAPLLTILAYSFFKDGYLTIVREFTLENYLAVWSDPIFHKIMLRSLAVARVACAGLRRSPGRLRGPRLEPRRPAGRRGRSAPASRPRSRLGF